MTRFLRAGAATLPMMLAAAAPSPPGQLTVEIGNIRAAHGRVHLDVCPQARFLKDGCAFTAEAPARLGTTTLIVRGLPPGRYAVQAFLDENGNGRVDRALFGIPKEGVGFSNDAPIRLGPPSFDLAAFDHGAAPQMIRFKLRYFLGAQGPG